MQGLLAAALAPTAPPRSQPSSARPAPAPLSSANLALHTSTNPPAPRRTVQQFLASVTRVHAANAYDLGQPPAGELDHVKTPPRAVEARRKRKLQDLEDRGESWIPRDKTTPRAATTGTEQALVLIRSDADLVHRGSTTSETADVKQHERKKSLVASMMRRKSTPPANASARSTAQRQPLLPISGPSPASNGSSILMPRTETKTATTRQKEGAEERGGKENRAGREKKSSLRKGKNASRRDTDKDAEQEELEEHQARACNSLSDSPYTLVYLLNVCSSRRSRSASRPASPKRSDSQGPLARRECGRRSRRCQAQEVKVEAASRDDGVRIECVVVVGGGERARNDRTSETEGKRDQGRPLSEESRGT